MPITSASAGPSESEDWCLISGVQLRDILEAAPDALMAQDNSGVIVLANAQVEILFGYQRGELLGQPLELLVPERFRDAHRAHRARYAAHPHARPMGTGLRLACRRKDGSEFWAEISLSPVVAAGQLLVVSSIRDVSERVRAEDERAALLVREETARVAAEAAIRARDEMLSVAAHELRTPVTSLRGYAQLLLRQLRNEGVLQRDMVRRALEIIDQSSARLVDLVGQLLDLSRIRAGRLVLQPQEVELTSLVRRVVAATQLRAGEHRFVVNAPANLLACVDPLRLEQVLASLLDNAVKFSPTGAPIRVRLSANEGLVRLSVRDYGPGISRKQRAHIFDRFYQGHAGDTLARGPGMGLGLYISREIVELHSGQIGVQLARGGGTRFSVSFPLRG